MPLKFTDQEYIGGIILLWAVAHILERKRKARDTLKRYDLLDWVSDFISCILWWILCATGSNKIFWFDIPIILTISGVGASTGVRGLNKIRILIMDFGIELLKTLVKKYLSEKIKKWLNL